MAEKTPRMGQIEAMLRDDPNDSFLRYCLAMEHSGAGDDESAAAAFAELIAADPDYIPAYLMAAQALNRMGEEPRAAEVLRAGIARAEAKGDPEAMHAAGEMRALLAATE